MTGEGASGRRQNNGCWQNNKNRTGDNMKDKLQEILDKREDLERQLSEAVEAERQLKHKMVTDAGQGLFGHIRNLADSFKSGHTRKLYDKVQNSLVELEALDSNYMATLASGSPYGEAGSEETDFLISYLLGGKWRPDSILWDVIDKIAELRSQPGNLFLNENERR
jgi:hypothetical protein